MPKYYEISEAAAKRAKDMNSYSDYAPGSATAGYQQMVDEAYALAEKQKAQVDPMYHDTSAFTMSVSSRPRLPVFTSIILPSVPWTSGHFPSRPATPRMRSSTTISASRLKMDHFWRGGI